MRFFTHIQDYLRHLRSAPTPLPTKTAGAVGIVFAIGLVMLFSRNPKPLTPPPALPNASSVGTESIQSVVLDQSTYKVAEVTDTTPLLVRINAIESTGNGTFSYHLSYTGLETGVFNLTDFLVTPTGKRLKEPVSTVTIGSVIPPNATYSALSTEPPFQPNAFPYRLTLLVGALAWAGWGAFLFWPAKKHPPAQEHSPSELQQPDPAENNVPDSRTLADMLRPLVEKAANKSISSQEKAALERILFQHWGRDLELDHLNSVEQLRRILEHPTAGALLRTIEQWLYQPDSLITEEEINTALESYLGIPFSEMPSTPSRDVFSKAPHTNDSTIIAA